MQMAKEERECEFQLRREMELKQLEADTDVRMHQVELQACMSPAAEA